MSTYSFKLAMFTREARVASSWSRSAIMAPVSSRSWRRMKATDVPVFLQSFSLSASTEVCSLEMTWVIH
uniref:Uncharacterized protein n=1 Tax=Oryza meridionalis TaxID=40149 RepID=A0A0E0DKG9_9ORYZ